MRNHKDIKIWSDVSDKDWQDWRWQMRNSISTLDELEQIINLSEDEKIGVEHATQYLKMKISPHLSTLMDPNNPNDQLRKQFVPSERELISIDDENLFSDVNADDEYSPTKGLVHRYPSKVLIFPSNYCGAYCRYCFRRKLARDYEENLSKDELERVLGYIGSHPEIEEVIFSGGDPLVLGDHVIEMLLDKLSAIETVQIVRFHTRMPVTVPYRITDDFINVLNKYKERFPIYIVIHVDSVQEISDMMRLAVGKLVNNGFPCFASCPLLKGINDEETALRNLWTELIKMRVKPYYLFHSDPVKGLKHFLVPIKRGLEIIRNLYDRMSGMALPHYIFNAPGGGGHVLLAPTYISEVAPGHYIITTFEGEKFEYTENL